MANMIYTTGADQSVPTQSTGYSNPAEWLDGHKSEVEEFELELGDNLTTAWPDASGPPDREVTTPRNPDEPDQDYLDRHFARVAEDMLEHPPIP
jgi:hypothetical protein